MHDGDSLTTYAPWLARTAPDDETGGVRVPRANRHHSMAPTAEVAGIPVLTAEDVPVLVRTRARSWGKEAHVPVARTGA